MPQIAARAPATAILITTVIILASIVNSTAADDILLSHPKLLAANATFNAAFGLARESAGEHARAKFEAAAAFAGEAAAELCPPTLFDDDGEAVDDDPCLLASQMHADALRNAAFMANKLGAYADARTLLDAAADVAYVPETTLGDIALAHAVVAQRVGDHDAALVHLDLGRAGASVAPHAIDAFRGDSLAALGRTADAAAAYTTAYHGHPRRMALDKAVRTLRSLGESDAAGQLLAHAVEAGILRVGLEEQRPHELDGALEGKPVWTLDEATPDGSLAAFVASQMPLIVDEVHAALAADPDALAKWYAATGSHLLYAHDAALYRCVDPGCPETRWHQVGLWETGSPTDAAYAFPQTIQSFFDTLKPVLSFGRVLFSVLDAGVDIVPHVGPTNRRLTVHCGVAIPDVDGLYLRVADHNLSWADGECFVFDDSFEHQVAFPHPPSASSPAAPRIVLLFHIPHPGMSAN